MTPEPWHRLVGTAPDAEIAEEVGRSKQRVAQVRASLGIPPYKGDPLPEGDPLPFAVRESNLARGLWFYLVDRWCEKFGSSRTRLAARLGIAPQKVSTMQHPPTWAILAMADDLRVAIYLTGDGPRIVRRRGDAPGAAVDVEAHVPVPVPRRRS